MTSIAHAERISMPEHAPRLVAAMMRLEQTIELDPSVRHLVRLRASQINGCAFCIDMHWKEARADGEPEDRLYALSAWRESPLYSERERAALELCEAVTLVADTHVPDDAWERAAAAFEPGELAQLVAAIATINAWNRVAISSRVAPGSYRPPAPA